MPRLCAAAILLTLCASCVHEEAPSTPCEALDAEAPEAIVHWIDQDCYVSWQSESRVLQATMSDSHAQIFVNPLLSGSLRQGEARHPDGAAAVRVIYHPDKTTVLGHALAFKTSGNWFWFEHLRSQAQPGVATFDAGQCTDCHATGEDFIHSRWPLR